MLSDSIARWLCTRLIPIEMRASVFVSDVSVGNHGVAYCFTKEIHFGCAAGRIVIIYRSITKTMMVKMGSIELILVAF